jgi:PKD repeat protein
VSYTVNVVNSSAINLFDVRLTYNYTVLHGASIDSSSNVLGSDAQVLYNCLDGVRPPGACDDRDGPGITHFGLFLLGNVSVTPPPTGVLFKITFNIVGPGFSQLHLVPGGSFGTVLLIGKSNVALRTQDGYFNNKICGLLLCKPPVADFTFSPSLAVLGRTVTFNATASRAANANAVIRSHFWAWGDEQNPSQSTENVTTHTFRSIGNFSVTLAVTDSYGISWSETMTVPVISVYIQLLVGQITIEPRYRVSPGALVKITADVINNSTLPESSNMTIAVEGLILGGQASKQFSLGPFRQHTSLTVDWDTTGYVPRVYRVDAIVIQPKGANSTKGNIGSGYVQLIDPMPSGSFSLSLLETTGLGIVLLAAIGFVVTRLRRRPSYADEPL